MLNRRRLLTGAAALAAYSRIHPARALSAGERILLLGAQSPAQAFLARTTGLSAKHQVAYTTFINALVLAGVWPLLKVLYVLATQNSTVALLNLINDTFTLVPIGPPTFTVDQGYAGDGVSTLLDTQWLASNFTSLNNLSMFGWALTHTNGNGQWGCFDVGGRVGQLASSSSPTNMFIRMNRTAGADINLTIPTDIGFFGASRTSSTNVDAQANATQFIGNTQASTVPTITSMKICGVGVNPGDFDVAQVGMFGAGNAMTPAQMNATFKAAHLYMQTIAGVP